MYLEVTLRVKLDLLGVSCMAFFDCGMTASAFYFDFPIQISFMKVMNEGRVRMSGWRLRFRS